MKTATLFAAIAVVFQTLGTLYYLLINFDVMNYNPDINKVIQALLLLSGIGLIVFFFQLYQRQTKN